MADTAKAAPARITVGSATTGKDMKMFEISFDLETLSLDADAQILSIGAVRFYRDTGEIGRSFHRVIDMRGPNPGKIDASTVTWWMQQSREAQKAVFGDDVEKVSLLQALKDFSYFCEGAEEFWQRGDKDATWLENSYARVGLRPPFEFWQVNDQRTMTKAFGHLISEIERGTAHNALEDAIFQAKSLCAIFKATSISN